MVIMAKELQKYLQAETCDRPLVFPFVRNEAKNSSQWPA
jgi:hypothetical protein